MLAIQKWLIENNGDFNQLNIRYGINATYHENEDDERVILNYCQIDSYKHRFDPIVRECRGLVLNKNDFSLIARGFNRFFNLGENPNEDNKFEWDDCYIQEKVDGSLIICYFWKGQWRVNTRGSFGQSKLHPELHFTWTSLFALASPFHGHNWDENLTYVYELCSPYNKVVRNYVTPTLYLLSAFNGENELSAYDVDMLANISKLNRPQEFHAKSADEINVLIKEIGEDDPTFEGVVVRDSNNCRIKMKQDKYLALHRLKNNGNSFLLKNIIPLVLQGEEEEIICYFPEAKDKILMIKDQIQSYRDKLSNIWLKVSKIENQKEFALQVKNTGLSSFLFSAKKLKIDPIEIFNKNPDQVLRLFE